MSDVTTRPPRDNLFRAVMPGVELRAAETGTDAPVMTGHFAVFNRWTEINSIFEGRFMERFAPGAFKKTFRENRDGLRVLFQHGGDPQIGDKPLGPIETLNEDSTGAYYEVPLLEASYVRDNVLPGLKAGLYGASFRFRVVREEINDDPGASPDNPAGLPERTVKEAQVMEFGPVTFPAYAEATAGVRSMTDDFIMRAFGEHPERLRALLDQALPVERTADEESDDNGTAESEADAPSIADAAPTGTSAPERRETGASRRAPIYGTRRKETSKPWLLGPSKSTKRS